MTLSLSIPIIAVQKVQEKYWKNLLVNYR